MRNLIASGIRALPGYAACIRAVGGSADMTSVIIHEEIHCSELPGWTTCLWLPSTRALLLSMTSHTGLLTY